MKRYNYADPSSVYVYIGELKATIRLRSWLHSWY